MPFAYFHPGGIVHKTRSNSESVLFVSPYPIHRITGIGRFVLDLSKKLSAQGFETTVLSPRGEQRQHDGRHTEIVLRTTFLANLELSMKTAAECFLPAERFGSCTPSNLIYNPWRPTSLHESWGNLTE